jgi:hypothetical protein
MDRDARPAPEHKQSDAVRMPRELKMIEPVHAASVLSPGSS